MLSTAPGPNSTAAVGLAQGHDLDVPVLLEVLPSCVGCAGTQGQLAEAELLTRTFKADCNQRKATSLLKTDQQQCERTPLSLQGPGITALNSWDTAHRATRISCSA